MTDTEEAEHPNPDSYWTDVVCLALDTDFGILAHPDDCASLCPLLEELDGCFGGDFHAAYLAMKARTIAFEYESRTMSWHLKADLSTIPKWNSKPHGSLQ